MSHTPEESIRNLRNRNRRSYRSTAPKDLAACLANPNAHWHETLDFPECRKEDGTCGHTKRCKIYHYCHIPHPDGNDIVLSQGISKGRCRTLQSGKNGISEGF